MVDWLPENESNRRAIVASRPPDMRCVELASRDGSLVAVLMPSLGRGSLTLVAAIFWCGCLFAGRHSLWLHMGPLTALMVILGLAFLYAGLALLLSRTRVSLSRDAFRCETAPLPLLFGIREPTRDVRGFVVSTGMSRSEPGGLSYRVVHVEMADGRMLRLPFQFDADSHAAFLAARLNSTLDSFRERVPTYRS